MRHFAVRTVLALRTQRSLSLIRQAVAVAKPPVSNSSRANCCLVVSLLPSAAFSTAHRVALGSLCCLASVLRTSSSALVKSWTTWNQSTVTLASGKFSPMAVRNAGDMSQTISVIFLQRRRVCVKNGGTGPSTACPFLELRRLPAFACGQHRHLPHQGQGRLLEQQGKAAALPGPGGVDSLDAVIGAVNPGKPGGDVAMMLEKIKVTPGELLKVMGFAQHSADRARIPGATVGGYLQEHLVRCFVREHPLAHQLP